MYKLEYLFDSSYIDVLYCKVLRQLDDPHFLGRVEDALSMLDIEVHRIVLVYKRLCKSVKDPEMEEMVEDIMYC